MLDLINRVQMFQIASSRVNQNLLQRKKNPIFNLQFTETFEGQEEDSKQTEDDDLASIMGSDMDASRVGSAINQQSHGQDKMVED